MPQNLNILKLVLLLGDIFLFYLALFFALAFRHGGFSFWGGEEMSKILYHFSFLLPLWFLFLYIFDFYESSDFKKSQKIFQNFAGFLGLALVSGIAYFYFIPQAGIAPKTILVLVVLIFGILLTSWRRLLSAILKFGSEQEEENTYRVKLEEVDEKLIREYVEQKGKLDESLERLLDILFGLVGLVLLSFLFLFAALAIKLTSPGPIFYTQKRVGKNGLPFTLYKFRTMVQDAEKEGPQWAKEKDTRITSVGRILRFTHLDELPQAINLLRGDISLVGPRPERPEFVQILEKEIPHYNLRHLVKPGIFGWAQLNLPYGDSVEDAAEKLKYDLYYIKHRSIFFDLLIVLRSIKIIVFAKGR